METLNYKLASVRPDLVPHIEKSLESVPQVQSVHLDLDASSVTIEHDGANTDEILAVLRDEGIETK